MAGCPRKVIGHSQPELTAPVSDNGTMGSENRVLSAAFLAQPLQMFLLWEEEDDCILAREA